jgi:predicted ArsR family transcriptional regulator
MSDDALSRLGVLAVGLRRRMYDFIRERRAPVSREEAAAAIGISRKLAAFHLDKLVDARLLKAHYARPGGRGGPGAGRPSKLYEPGEDELQVSVPERHYDLPGEILLAALETRRLEEEARAAVERVAHGRGLTLGQKGGRRHQSAVTALQDVLRDCGFEPYIDGDGALRLWNCPFSQLAQRSPEIVCEMNRALIEGLLEGMGDRTSRALLEPRPDECCVAVRGLGAT